MLKNINKMSIKEMNEEMRKINNKMRCKDNLTFVKYLNLVNELKIQINIENKNIIQNSIKREVISHLLATQKAYELF